ncbi:hypothetical protein DENSPDRAFT_836602, partial [Dentipellis sp. KUC8613]
LSQTVPPLEFSTAIPSECFALASARQSRRRSSKRSMMRAQDRRGGEGARRYYASFLGGGVSGTVRELGLH